jgi:hypothetical protein
VDLEANLDPVKVKVSSLPTWSQTPSFQTVTQRNSASATKIKLLHLDVLSPVGPFIPDTTFLTSCYLTTSSGQNTLQLFFFIPMFLKVPFESAVICKSNLSQVLHFIYTVLCAFVLFVFSTKVALQTGRHYSPSAYFIAQTNNSIFTVGEYILLRMYQISKYKQPPFATVLQRALLYTYITTCFG